MLNVFPSHLAPSSLGSHTALCLLSLLPSMRVLQVFPLSLYGLDLMSASQLICRMSLNLGC